MATARLTITGNPVGLHAVAGRVGLDVVLLMARLGLTAVFLLASVTKLLDLPGSRQALASFGIPQRLTPSIGLLLPLAELVVAVALIPRWTGWWGALGAFILLTLFVIGIAASLARGKTPDCHCFGQLYSEPVGRSTLVRNVALAGLAGLVLWQGWGDPGSSVVGWIGSPSSIEWILIVAVATLASGMAAEGWILINLVKQNGRLLLRLDDLEAQLGTTGDTPPVPPDPTRSRHELPIGSAAPDFELGDLDQNPVTLTDLLEFGKPTVLFFSDPNCSSCTSLLPDIARWQLLSSRLTLGLISRGSSESNRAKIKDLSIRHVLLQRDREVAQAYGARATPSAVIVNPDGMIGSRVAVGPVAIRRLLDSQIADARDSARLSEIGVPPPQPSRLP